MGLSRWRAVLASLLLAALGAVVAALAVSVLQTRATSTRQLRQASQDRAALAAALINDVILGAPKAGPPLTPDPRTLAAINRLSGNAIVAVVDGSGRVLAAPPGLGPVARRLASGGLVHTALDLDRRQVSNLLGGVGPFPAGFEEVTPYPTPAGRRAMVSWLAQDPVDAILDRYLTNLAHYTIHARHTHAWLLDGSGAVIATSAPGTAPRRQAAAAGLLTAVAQVPSAPWRIVYQVPLASLYSTLGGAFTLSLALVGALLLAGLACLALLLRLVASLRALHDANRELARRNADVERATEAKSRFVANMSHELRTPLNAVIGFSELLRDGRTGAVSSTQREYLDIVLSSADHILTLVDDVLDLARVESGRLRLDPREIDPVAVGRDCARSLLALAEEREIAVELVSGRVGTCLLDDARLRQVILNFLSNALKFTGRGGRVQLTIDRDGDDLLVEVSDTGRGIARDDQPRVFEEFVQLDGARRDGSGLGLAVTRLIVEAQGGEVGVRSELGSGSTFWARLPAPPVVHDQGPATDGPVVEPPGHGVLDPTFAADAAAARAEESPIDPPPHTAPLPAGGLTEPYPERAGRPLVRAP